MKIKFLSPLAQMPKRGSDDAAGYDLYAAIENEMIIPAHETRKIPTGLAMEIPDGYYGGIFARSGLATQKGLRPANVPGCVDSDYRGEVIVALHNDSGRLQSVMPGERIAQLIISPYCTVNFEVVDELDKTHRGAGGFGSTGTK